MEELFVKIEGLSVGVKTALVVGPPIGVLVLAYIMWAYPGEIVIPQRIAPLVTSIAIVINIMYASWLGLFYYAGKYLSDKRMASVDATLQMMREREERGESGEKVSPSDEFQKLRKEAKEASEEVARRLDQILEKVEELGKKGEREE